MIENPFAGRYVEDLSPLIAIGEELGELLSKRAVAALGIDGAKAQSYGKAAAVGENGELEHAAAILHPKMGAPVRKVLGKGAALIPSSKKRSGPGTTLDIPLGHKDAAFVRSHFDGMEVQINDAPRANEIMVAVAVTDSGRPLPRVGGLTVAEVKGEDGLTIISFNTGGMGCNEAEYFLGAGLAIMFAGMAHSAMAQSEIKIGEINSYSLLPAFTEPYRKGWQLAVEEINAAGGINGKKLVVISKDDGGKPADAQTAANELVSSENVAMLTGTFLSNIGLAVSDFAKQKKVFFLAAEPLTDAITWSKGNRYTFRLRPSNYMQAAMLAEEAAKLPAKRWATIAPNYEYGQSAVARVQEADVGKAARHPVGRRAVAAVRQDRCRPGGAGARRRQSGSHPQRHLRRRSREVRARRQHPRPVQGSHGGLLPDRRAGISRSAEGRNAGGLDRHRLSLVQHQDAGA